MNSLRVVVRFFPRAVLLFWVGVVPAVAAESDPVPLWAHVRRVEDLGEMRDLTAAWDGAAGGTLQLAAVQSERYAWAVIPPPIEGWALARRATVEAEIVNRGTEPVSVLLWVVGDRGWDAVPSAARLAPGEARPFSCALRETFPDGTPKIDPHHVKQIQVMLSGRIAAPVAIEVRRLVAAGGAPEWVRPPARLEIPPVEDANPAPGRRVRHRLPGEEQPAIAAVLHLPADWKADARFPLIVEYPGNIFMVPGCYSTGRPEQCAIGFGITRGRGAICLSLPFVDRSRGEIAEHGWGDPGHTADYAVRMVEEVCAQWGADRDRILLTGFSRGAIACGFIGLRNDRIAALWTGIHACQHSDGDGWNGATMAGAIERARRFRGRAIFHTDNAESAFRPVMEAMRAPATYARSGLGAHATAMFLDDRPSTQQLRQWVSDLFAGRP